MRFREIFIGNNPFNHYICRINPLSKQRQYGQHDIFKRWNNIVGWTVFAIAAAVYLMTMEPVSSLWDCSEFIATSYKLEVGHPPGPRCS